MRATTTQRNSPEEKKPSRYKTDSHCVLRCIAKDTDPLWFTRLPARRVFVEEFFNQVLYPSLSSREQKPTGKE